MTYHREELRALTLADNFQWLRSFGCTVEERNDMTFIHHPRIQDYNAWLYTRSTQRSVEQLRRLTHDGADGADVVYVDNDVVSEEALSLLSEVSTPSGTNLTIARNVRPRPPVPRIQMREATSGEIERWASIYSRGFARLDQAEADLERWRLAFASSHLRHWFFVESGQLIGVCQTTRGAIQGVYSFTLLPGKRGVKRTFDALRALLAAIITEELRWVYYESLHRSSPAALAPRVARRKHVIRRLTAHALRAGG